MRRHDRDQRLKAAAIVYAVGGVLFVVTAAVTLAWWIAAFGVAYLLLAAWNTWRLRRLGPLLKGPAPQQPPEGAVV